LIELPMAVVSCARCANLTDAPAEHLDERAAEPVWCGICSDTRRDDALLCVVARIQHLHAIERSGAMRGRYFVLGGLLSPLEGIGAEDLPIQKLKERVAGSVEIKEVLVATPPSVDGEATALLLGQILRPLNVSVSRIASGVPHGGDLEFADPITLSKAVAGRQDVE
jgi:recombination protein RecR